MNDTNTLNNIQLGKSLKENSNTGKSPSRNISK